MIIGTDNFTKQTESFNSATTDYIRSILTEVYPSQKTPSYCHSSKRPVSIDSDHEWVEKVKAVPLCLVNARKRIAITSHDLPKR